MKKALVILLLILFVSCGDTLGNDTKQTKKLPKPSLDSGGTGGGSTCPPTGCG